MPVLPSYRNQSIDAVIQNYNLIYKFKHRTKNEEILNAKLHFLCSEIDRKLEKSVFLVTIELKLLILFTRLASFSIEIITQYRRMNGSNKVDRNNKYDVT